MKKTVYYYLIWTLVISNLFYSEYLGLNALITTVVTLPMMALMEKDNLRRPMWWFSASTWLLAGIAIFINGSELSKGMYFIAILYFAAIHHNYRLSLPLGLTQSGFSSMMGIFFFFNDLAEWINKPKEHRNKKTWKFLIIGLTTILIGLIFLKLYQIADQRFAELTAFINLDWISWNFIGFYFITTLFLYGFYYYNGQKDLDTFEGQLKNDIHPEKEDRIQKFMGLNIEKSAAIAILTLLNLLLLLYNGIDLEFVANDLYSGDQTIRFSQVIHQGVDALIASIILVIIVISFIFRGGLNFISNKVILVLGTIWLCQNLIMISTTIFKNYAYVSHWGLTYKRIGVYVYLFLAFAGIVFTFIKIYRQKSFWYLLRTTSLSFFASFVIIGGINWNRLIAHHNLNKIPAERIDYDYILNLGADVIPEMICYQNKTHSLPDYVSEELSRLTPSYRSDLYSKKFNSTWRSMVWREYILLEELNSIEIQKVDIPHNLRFQSTSNYR